MASAFDRAIERTCDKVFADAIAPGGWLREQLRKHVRWHFQGFEPGFGLKERQAFTTSVAERIYEMARERLVVCGIRLWLVRWRAKRCEEMAEEVVSNFLESDRIKFGDNRYDWSDGRDIADDEMDNWERA